MMMVMKVMVVVGRRGPFLLGTRVTRHILLVVVVLLFVLLILILIVDLVFLIETVLGRLPEVLEGVLARTSALGGAVVTATAVIGDGDNGLATRDARRYPVEGHLAVVRQTGELARRTWRLREPEGLRTLLRPVAVAHAVLPAVRPLMPRFRLQ